jgi:GH15 family glucan-1,4-alpha-glucosidase
VGPVIESAADGLPREKGWSTDQQAFVQQYGSGVLDSSLLRMSSVGFVSPHDPM